MTPLDSSDQAKRPVTAFVWRDIVVLCDDGRADAGAYAGLREIAESVQRRYPYGVGVLIVVPQNAVPPGEEVRRAINETLASVEKSIRCMCWLVEGSGFQGAMVRAVLTGIRFVSHTSYARHVSMDLEHALTWMCSQLERGSSSLGKVEMAAAYIRERLASVRPSDVYPNS